MDERLSPIDSVAPRAVQVSGTLTVFSRGTRGALDERNSQPNLAEGVAAAL